jgi:selenocysteine-specific elongation factor
LKTQKKVKSIQVFRKPVDKASKGDRCGICLTNFDSKQFERGIVCAPNYVKHSFAIITRLHRIKHFKSAIESGSKFHITIGHETLLGKIDIFGECENKTTTHSNPQDEANFNFNNEYLHLNEYNASEEESSSSSQNDKIILKPKILNYYALIDFTFDSNDHAAASTLGGVLCSPKSLLIGSKLDTDIHLNTCRIAFHGLVLHSFTNKDFKETTTSNVAGDGHRLSDLKIYKEKSKEGVVERKHDEYTLIGRALFKKETNIDLFVGLKVKLSTGETGKIESSFGQSGKFKIRLDNGLLPSTRDQLEAMSGGGGGGGKSKKKQEASAPTAASVADEGSTVNSVGNSGSSEQIKVYLNFKRFIYDEKKKMIQ